jgi:serine/tyrosine/threonine adenylyltransferase
MGVRPGPDTVGSMTATPTSSGLVEHLDALPFTNRWTAALPADPDSEVRPRPVSGAAYTRVEPSPVSSPRTLAVSTEVADLLGLAPVAVDSQDFAEVFAGNRVPDGADPHAQNYGGHQFGNWAGQLGDGRAISLGEVRDARGGFQTLQLKGAGPTPYSRGADGRAVLRSSLREYLCSEAMHHLGIPTTRALSLVATGDEVVRDVLYDGNPSPESGAVVCRVAPSFTRFGTFQLPASRGELGLLRRLVDTTIALDFPHLTATSDPSFEDLLAAWFDEVVVRTADLVVDWMRVGFVHGVLNTDNMSILGLTIDYGPYGWLEDFDPGWTPNTTDAATRRYRYGAQPQVAHWNLLQLAQALATLVPDDTSGLEAALNRFPECYHSRYLAMMATRLGWGDPDPERDVALIETLFGVLTSAEIDQVLFFRDLARVPVGPEATDDELLAPLGDAWYEPTAITGEVRDGLIAWLRSWSERVRSGGVADDAERRRHMDAVNPRFVLRNYLAQEAIDAAEAGDTELLDELHEVLRRPYDEQPGKERFAERRPEWARTKVGCSMLSCSS